MRWRFTLNPATDNKLIAEPIGWNNIIFTFNRSKEWHGVFVEYSLPLKFYNDPEDSAKDAYTYLRAVYDLLGVEGYVILKVEYTGSDTDTFTEEGQWRLSFDTYREERSELYLIEMSLEPSNCLMTFKNRYDQKVDISSLETFGGDSMIDYDLIDFQIDLPPKAIPENSNIVADTEDNLELLQVDVVSAGTGTVIHNAIGYFQPEVLLRPDGLDEIDTRIDLGSLVTTNLADIESFLTILVPGEYTFTIRATMNTSGEVETNANSTDCGGLHDKFNDLISNLYIDFGGTLVSILSDSTTGSCASSLSHTITLAATDYVYTLGAGDEIKVYARVETSGEWDHDLLVAHDVNWTLLANFLVEIDIYARTLAEATPCQVSAINETGSRILESITDNCFKLLSSYYGRTDSEPFESPDNTDGCGSLRVLTVGLNIRQYSTLLNLRMSFKEWFEGLNAIDNIGIGQSTVTIQDQVIQNVIRVEPMEFWYGTNVLLQLDKIPFVVIEVIPEEHLSIFKIGYAKWENEQYTGLDEFATKREYRTTLTSVKNTKDQISNFIASGYAIEIGRRKKLYSPTTQEDWRYDNDTFVVCCKRDENDAFVVEQGNITGGSNLFDPPTVYNFRISPLRNLLRWAKTILNSYRDVFALTSTLEFTSGDGNIIAEGLMTGGCLIENAVIAENASVSQANLSDTADALPVYVPELWQFEYPLSLSQYQIIKADPTQIIQCRFNQEEVFHDFYIRNIDYRPNDGLAQFQLLPRRLYQIDLCSIYIIQTRGTGTTTFGSTPLTGASLSNIFLFVGGSLMKYNDANSSNNEIVSWDTSIGYGELSFAIPVGQQVTIIHLPINDSENGCSTCIDRYEGRGNGTDTVVMSGFGIETIERLFVFYNGELMKYNDTNPDNNELTSYTAVITKELEFAGRTHASRELRVFGIAGGCPCITVFAGNGDGTNTPELTGIGDATLANLLVFYNGNLQKYNDSNISNNEITGYSPGSEEASLNTPTHAARELRAVKLVNC